MAIEDRMIFIVGRSRSGTTLLARMLNAHPQIAIPPEGIFMYNFYNKYKHKKKWNNEAKEKLAKEILSESKMIQWNLSKNEIFNAFKQSKHNHYIDFCLEVYKLWAQKNGINNYSILGDQSPYYLMFIPKLLKIFPNAIFIFITRDYRDNILSLKNVSFDLNNTAALAYRYSFVNKKGLRLMKKFPKNFYHIKYENLVLKPKASLIDLCDYINIPFEENMLRFYENENEETRSWHQNLKNPILKENVYKWKNKMSKKDIKIADFYAGKIGKHFNYQPNSKPSFTLFWMTFPWLILGHVYSLIERYIFLLPPKTRIRIINLIRKSQNLYT